ncbi:MAG: hypothetical protein ACFFC3_04735 [Candidatus Odinarchaeota archaeon]
MATLCYPMNNGMDLTKRYLKQSREIPYIAKWRAFNTPVGKD